MAAGVTDMAVKVPPLSTAPKAGPWTTSREPASLWRADIDGNNVTHMYMTPLLNCLVVVLVLFQASWHFIEQSLMPDNICISDIRNDICESLIGFSECIDDKVNSNKLILW